MSAPQVSRWPNGVGDNAVGSPLANYAGLNPARYALYFDDFFGYDANDWVVTETDSGSTQAVTSAAGGVLAITNASAGAADEASLQWAGGSGAVKTQWTFDSTKDTVLVARFKVSNATNTALLIGLGSTDTTPVASLPTNGVYFYKAAASTSLLASLRASGTSQSVTLGTLANDTYVEAAFVYNSSTGYWQGFLDGVLIGSNTSPTTPSAAMALTMGLLNASAVAHVLSIDYLMVAQAR